MRQSSIARTALGTVGAARCRFPATFLNFNGVSQDESCESMADFAQNGIIGTLHNLRNRSTEELESELVGFSHDTPMSLLLPCLYSELEGPAMGPIVEELAKIP